MPRRKKNAPTIHEVATRAGVSPATAARALNNYGRIAETTREKVLAAAEEIGYRTNSLAQSMITGRTNTLGVVCADIHSPFFSGVVRGITDRAARANYSVLITNSDENIKAEEEALETLLNKRVDGVIISPTDVARVRHLQRVADLGTLIVLVDRASSHFSTDAVLIDGTAATREAVTRLLALGHRRIAIVAELRSPGEANWARMLNEEAGIDLLTRNPSSARLYGYIQAHRAAGVDIDPKLVFRAGGYSADAARQATLKGLQGGDPVTAVVAIDATMTIGAYRAIREAGRQIPEEISFIGFDDQEWTELVEPPVSVISQPVYEMGARATDMLLARLRGDQHTSTVLAMSTVFLERDSVASPPGLPEPEN